MEPTPPEEDSFFGRLKGYFSEVEAWLSAGSSELGTLGHTGVGAAGFGHGFPVSGLWCFECP